MSPGRCTRGFTLIEVLIAMAITAVVAAIAYASFSAVMAGVDSTRASAERVYAVNRAWMIISRDFEQIADRPSRDEFGEEEPAVQGGLAARFPLSLTRAGWHNPTGQARSTLERVNYRVEENALWRDSYPVLDRAGNSEPRSVKLLDGVVDMHVAFLENEAQIRNVGRGSDLDTRGWPENLVIDTSQPGSLPDLPLAVELRLELEDWGEMRRLYALSSR